jgi:hypothetical protein
MARSHVVLIATFTALMSTVLASSGSAVSAEYTYAFWVDNNNPQQ